MSRTVLPLQEPPAQSALRYFLSEAFRRIWISKRTSMVAVGMIAISLLILGIFLLIGHNLTAAVERWQGRSTLTAYLTISATPEMIRSIEQQLSRNAHFAKRRFVTPEAALAKFKTHFPHLATIVDELDENPFPPSFEIEVPKTAIRNRDFDREVSALRALDGVDDVQFDWEWIAKLKSMVNILTMIGLLAGGVLGVASAFMIANVIRLTMILYREEIEIMRLVGATEWVIRAPFVIEGILQGTFGGILSVALLYGAFSGAREIVTPANSLAWEFLLHDFLPLSQLLFLILAGTLAGFFGSWLSVREDVGRGTA